MRTIEYFKRMFSIIALYAAKLIQPSAAKRLPGSANVPRLETKDN